MPLFFKTLTDIELFLSRLAYLSCPSCGASGTLIRHGTIRGFVSENERGIRAWRFYCKKSPRRKGCGKAPSVRLAEQIPRRCFNTKQLWSFLLALKQQTSVKAAWEHSHIRLSLDTAYALYKRIDLCQSVLRTHLCSRAPPPNSEAGVPLFEVLDHLKESFGDSNPIEAYQETFQKEFLALA